VEIDVTIARYKRLKMQVQDSQAIEAAERLAALTCGAKPVRANAMDDKESSGRSNVHRIKQAKRLVSRPRIVMGLLLIIAIPIFIALANRAVNENADAIRQSFGR
jgi:hypothetical protein